MRFLLAIILSICFSTSYAQIYDPVKWETEYKQVSETEFDLIYKAKIEDGWTIYSQYLENDDGPIRTSFNYDDGNHFSLVGKNKESDNKKTAHDKVFDMTLIKFFKYANFTQRVKVTDLSKPIVGYLEFMTCDETKCLPPNQIDFEFRLENKMGDSSSGGKSPEPEPQPEPTPEPAPKKQPTPNRDLSLSSGNNAGAGGNNQNQSNTTTPKVEQKTSTPVIAQVTKPKVDIAPSANEADQGGGGNGFIEPAKWTVSTKKVKDGEIEIELNAKIIDGWYMYSQFQNDPEGTGPFPTEFNYDDGDHYKLIGKAVESGNLKKSYDKVFEMDVQKFVKDAVFTQKIKINDASKPITGYIQYQTCDDKACIMNESDFFVDGNAMQMFVGKTATEKIGALTSGTTSTETSTAVAGNIPNIYPSELASLNLSAPAKTCTEPIEQTTSIWGIFLLGILGGFVALLTPCVFPMIPLTVSFFTKSADDKNKGLRDAILYGFFIFLVYLVLSIPFHLMDSINPDILNDISTNVYLNVAFFLIFLFFAGSFFGYYELTLPQSWTNKASSAEGSGGFLGIFFMALTLALVSFSCTGPILGSLLAGALSSDGGAWQLTAGMGGFGLALAMPFALFAAFPQWMNSLPQSGGWLTTVKVVLGFLELALALKFLSNADMVAHWGILKYEVFMGLWVLIFAALAIYLFGKIKFPHDSPITKLSPVRMGLGILTAAFTIYLMTGFMTNKDTGTYDSKTLLSGLAPPVCYCWMKPCDCPGNLECFKDLNEGWAYAKKNNKPILIDFTGYACVNCRKMEEHVWPKKSIDKYLKEDYVLISLYVDDKKALPEEERLTVQKPVELGGGTRKLRTFGNKWSHLQSTYFANNSQPYYVLISPDGTLLSPPTGYTPEVEEYAKFLDCGVTAFKEGQKIGQK